MWVGAKMASKAPIYWLRGLTPVDWLGIPQAEDDYDTLYVGFEKDDPRELKTKNEFILIQRRTAKTN